MFTNEIDYSIWNDALHLKTAGEKFFRPENYEKIDTLEDGREVFAGAMDWEHGWTWAGVHAAGKGHDWENVPEEFMKVDHSACVCGGDPDNLKVADFEFCSSHGKRKVKDWIQFLNRDQDIDKKKKADFQAAIDEAVSAGKVCPDIEFQVYSSEKCLVNVGDWHEKEDCEAAVKVAKKFFKDVSYESEVGRGNDLQYCLDPSRAAAKAYKKTPAYEKRASFDKPVLTGPDAIHGALQRLNLARLEEQAKAAVKSGKVTKRPAAVKILNAVEGLRRNEVRPDQLMIQNVPVLPPAFRPFSMLGDTFVPGDGNELYRDMFDMIEAYKGANDMFGDGGASNERMHLYDSVKALYGFGDPVKPKTKQRGVSGFLRQVTGANPKFGVVQRRLLSKAQDSVSRGVITIGADLGMDEIAVPEEMAWTMYAPYVQGRLARMGLSPVEALKHLKDRTPMARKALEMEVPERPVVYSRAPSWHKFNVLSGIAKLVPGDTIAINPFVTTGLNADFDGDTINLHVPSQRDAVDEAREKLMPSKMLFSIRDQNKVVPVIKHEQLLSLFSSNARPSQKTHQFGSKQEALAAIRERRVPLRDEVDFPDEQ